MGNQSSTLLLVPQAHFPHVLSARYARAHTATLRLEASFWSHSYPEPLEIRDVTTNLTMFHIPTTSNHKTHSKRLLDMYNAPVATMTTVERTSRTATTTITPAATHHHHGPERPCCTVETKLLDDYGTLTTQASWGDNTKITCEGDWSHPHNISFWLENTQHHRPERHSHHVHAVRIAHIHSDPAGDDSSDSYLLEIAPGVDVALILLICAANDEVMVRHRSHLTGTTSRKRASRMEIAKPPLRQSNALPVRV
jgi:hypothetical protein